MDARTPQPSHVSRSDGAGVAAGARGTAPRARRRSRCPSPRCRECPARPRTGSRRPPTASGRKNATTRWTCPTRHPPGRWPGAPTAPSPRARTEVDLLDVGNDVTRTTHADRVTHAHVTLGRIPLEDERAGHDQRAQQRCCYLVEADRVHSVRCGARCVGMRSRRRLGWSPIPRCSRRRRTPARRFIAQATQLPRG